LVEAEARSGSVTSDSTCAYEPTRRVAGSGASLHAGFTDIDALI
jgi:hypothetical protein